MALSLKDANRTPLMVAALANAAAYYVALKSDSIVSGHWIELVRGGFALIPAGAVAVLVGLLNAQLSAQAKARLVFWRWNNPLPGSVAFSKLAARDQRVDLGAIERKHGPLPTKPEEQNRLWYRFYKSVENAPAVQQVHREFLFARDFACLVVLLAMTLGVSGFFVMPSTKTALSYLLLLIIEYLVATRAARVHGSRFVTTVLALKGASS